MNLKPGNIVKWAHPPGVSVVLNVEKHNAWAYILFLLPDNRLIEITELLQVIDEFYKTIEDKL
jgi:hypothetical protein